MTNDYKERVKLAVEIIANAGMEAYAAKNTEEFDYKFEKLHKCIKDNYYDYLYYNYLLSKQNVINENKNYSTDMGLHDYEKEEDSLQIAYIAISEAKEELKKAVDKYNYEKNNNFFYYLEKGYYIRIKVKAIRKEYFKFKRQEMEIDIDAERKERLIKKALKFLDERDEKDFTNVIMEKFATENGISLKKMEELWKECRHIIKFKEIDKPVYDDEGNDIGLSIIDDCIDDEFEEIISDTRKLSIMKDGMEILNVMYFKDFTRGMQKYYPHIFTIDFIKEIVNEVKKATKSKSTIEVITKHWDEIELVWYRDKYAIEENVCVVRCHFDWSIENHQIRDDVMLAKFMRTTPQNISKIKRKTIKLIKRKVDERQYVKK